MRRRLVPVVCALLASLPPLGEAAAQDAPLALELTGLAGMPAGSFADGSGVGEGTTAGPAFRVAFLLPRNGRPSFYLGFAQARFGCEAAGCSSDERYVSTGFNLGLRVDLVRGHRAVPWLGAGVVTTRMETGDLPSPDDGVSRLGFGGEAAAGVRIEWSRVALQPTVTWTTVNTDLPGGAALGLRYLSAGLALVFPF